MTFWQHLLHTIWLLVFIQLAAPAAALVFVFPYYAFFGDKELSLNDVGVTTLFVFAVLFTWECKPRDFVFLRWLRGPSN